MNDAPLLVLGKIRAILDAFSLDREALTAAEIRRATGLPASTLHRLLGNLVEHGFLDRVDDRYSIGVRMAFWAGPAVRGRDIADVIGPVLQAVRDETSETATFFRVEGLQRVCIGVAQTRHGLRRDMELGRVQPLHVGSSGRVLLAWTPGLLERVVEDGLEAMTADTIVDEAVLRQVVAETRAQGFATTQGERVEAASGIAAPVFDRHGDLLGALGVMGPTLRLTPERIQELIDPVVAAAQQLTGSMGGRPPAAGGRER